MTSSDTASAKQVLVIEDDPGIRHSTTMVLEVEGYTAHGVANGQEALDYLQRQQSPSLILLDLMMPIMDGWQFRHLQQQDPRLARIPVVIISAAGSVGEKATSLGANGYLQKPVDVDQLLATVHRFCDTTFVSSP